MVGTHRRVPWAPQVLRAAAHTAAWPGPHTPLQVLEEHVRAFQFNIDIMRQYPMSVRTRLRALRLVPAKAWASAALALVTVSVVIGAILVMHSAEQRKVDG